MKTIATVGGIGYFPVAPGTAGSVVGLVIAWILSGSVIQQWIGCAVALALGLWSAGPTARAMAQPDPAPVVIDEVCGMMLAVVALPVTWAAYLTAFALFRLLDVAKPWPIRRLERFPGSWGILLDDVAAGLATNLLIRFLRL